MTSSAESTTSRDAASTRATGSDRLPREHRNVIALLLVAAFVVILNETVMSVALPVLQRDLGVDPSVGQWLTTAFMLTMAVIIPTTGYLIQRIPTRVLFIIAMSLFSAGTLLAFLAPGFGILLLARVVQASGTAIMMPLLMTTVLTLVPPARRGQMMGNISIVISVAPALGPTVSGFILDHFGWRWIFGFVLPIALVSLALGAKWIRSVSETGHARLDLVSIPLAALGFGGLVYGLASIGESAEAEPFMPVWAFFTIGVVSLALFLLRQLQLQRAERALLDLRVFRSPIFSVSMAAMLLGTLTMFGVIILIPYYAQSVLGLDPLATGLITLPGGLLMGIASPFIGRIYDKRGPRTLILPGTILVSIALWMLTMVGLDTPIWYLIISNILMSVGLSATFTPVMTSGLGSLNRHLYSHGSAVLSTFQQVAAAAGTALFITVMSVGAASAAADGALVATDPEAILVGVRSAFLIGGILSVALIVAGLFVKKPADAPAGAVHAH
ncbi:MDR family MFS transporter [Herbiconiux sp. L3-i23]|uniref:MDR family MFS transporter n=1 Tax=Herbiconiux sp. L3-i23 TaxID=2905871 RepID=UPI0020633AAD|nr:MDR family MFS transporter [Herbiconiux sp. L3-i23]BDI23656.1 MFS transporter [Herbiconiux sp. L3-i23]